MLSVCVYFGVPYTGTYLYRWNGSTRHGTLYCINFVGHLFTYHLMLKSAPIRPLQRWNYHTLLQVCFFHHVRNFIIHTYSDKIGYQNCSCLFWCLKIGQLHHSRLQKVYHLAKAVKTECSANYALSENHPLGLLHRYQLLQWWSIDLSWLSLASCKSFAGLD